MFNADEIARDVLALGSTVFYVLVVLRTLVGPFPVFTARLVIAGIVIFLAAVATDFDGHVARGMAAGFFLALYYSNPLFNVFASIVFISLVYASYRLGREQRLIWRGMVVGVASIATGYHLTSLLSL